MYNIDTQEEVVIHMFGFDGIRRDNYFGGEPIGRSEVELRVGKLKNGDAAGKDEITGETIKGGGNMAFESGVVPEEDEKRFLVIMIKELLGLVRMN